MTNFRAHTTLVIKLFEYLIILHSTVENFIYYA